MEAGPLAQVAVVRLQDLGRGRVGHQLVDPAPVRVHDPEVELLGAAHVVGHGHVLPARGVLDGGIVVRPPVVHQVDVDGPAHHDGLEVVHSGPLPARPEAIGEVRIGGTVAPLADGRRCALEHVEVLRRLGERRHALDAAGPGADECDDLVLQTGEGFVRTATGVPVVPPGRVERASGELLHARDGGQFHEVEDSDGQHVPSAADLVASVGADPPPGFLLVPFGAGDPGVEQGVGHEVEPVGDRLEVAPDLIAERVALARDVVELLQHRHVDVRLDIAHHPGVLVPVPGAPDASGLVDDADPPEAGLAELGAGQHPGDAPTHDHHVDFVDDRVAVDHRCERVTPVAGEALVGPQIADGGAVGDQPLVPLGQVLGADGLWVVALRRRGDSCHPAILGQVWSSTSGCRSRSDTAARSPGEAAVTLGPLGVRTGSSWATMASFTVPRRPGPVWFTPNAGMPTTADGQTLSSRGPVPQG